MKTYAITGDIVLENQIIKDGVAVIDGKTLAYAGEKSGFVMPDKVLDFTGKLIGPGFVDIHCHAGHNFLPENQSAEEVVYDMLRQGTTGMLISLYRSINHTRTLEAISKIKELMKEYPNILGVHMEGPYLNPKYGSVAGSPPSADVRAIKEEYRQIIDEGIVVQWTFAPEVENSEEFLKDIVSAGIVPAIGHSEADVDQVKKAAMGGARIVTHMFDATGCGRKPYFEGTLELTFDQAAMLCDNLYYEVICDKNGYHVRYEMLDLLIKTVGIERIAAISDFTMRSSGGMDITVLDNNGEPELCGSSLTMRQVAENLKNRGFSITDIFKMTSATPAKAIKYYDKIGSLEKGKLANIVITDYSFKNPTAILMGDIVK